jgi:hypothetical protein
MLRKNRPMDFANFKSTSAKIEIFTPSGEPGGLFVWLLPPDHPKFRALEKRYSSRLYTKKGAIDPKVAEEYLSERCLLAIEKWEWTGDATLNGERPEYNPEDEVQRSVLNSFWFRNQIVEAYEDSADFFKSPSSNNSAKPSKS